MGKINKIEKLREEMHKCIDTYGFNDERTLKISRKLDKLIAIRQLQKVFYNL